jgi:hypothetical protein
MKVVILILLINLYQSLNYIVFDAASVFGALKSPSLEDRAIIEKELIDQCTNITGLKDDLIVVGEYLYACRNTSLKKFDFQTCVYAEKGGDRLYVLQLDEKAFYENDIVVLCSEDVDDYAGYDDDVIYKKIMLHLKSVKLKRSASLPNLAPRIKKEVYGKLAETGK